MDALSRRDFLLGAAALAVAPTIIGKVATSSGNLGAHWVRGGASDASGNIRWSSVTLHVGETRYTLTDAEMERLATGEGVLLSDLNIQLRCDEPYLFRLTATG